MESSGSNVVGGSNEGPLYDSFRTELLSPAAQAVVDQIQSSWRLNVNEFHLPECRRSSDHHWFSVRRLLPTPSMYM